MSLAEQGGYGLPLLSSVGILVGPGIAVAGCLTYEHGCIEEPGN